MARAYRCDRCKAFYDKPSMSEDVTLEDIPIAYLVWGHRPDSISHDICPNCAKSFIHWFMQIGPYDKEVF